MLRLSHKKLYDTDTVMKNVWRTLVRDFRSTLDDPLFCIEQENALNMSLGAYRSFNWPGRMISPVYEHKCAYQLESLFKRYRFKNDVFSDKELAEKTYRKFSDTQLRIGVSSSHPLYTERVLNLARKYASDILGAYSLEEHQSLCRFGRRASVGCPARSAYLEDRLSRPLSGSLEHIRWFKNYLQTDAILSEFLAKSSPIGEPRFEVCTSLTLTLVPKSFKSLRVIMPNTTIGTFYTYGLGRMIQSRLRSVGLNISTLQGRHAKLVREFSKTRSHVTADLSSASDTFTSHLVNRLLPRSWFTALDYGRISTYTYNGARYSMSSFMTMGIGFTFQLQTLLFYCLLKAIKDLLKVPGLVSVYGDDLIYPIRMHGQVVKVFESLHFCLNDDKTFTVNYFRESCGSDCYFGFDVRPHQPEGSHQECEGRPYVSFLYKLLNGLTRRWDKSEINQTIRYIYSEILRVDQHILQVPPLFPDYSGQKVETPNHDTMQPIKGVWYNGNHSICFSYYRMFSRDRIVKDQRFYYWEKLRSSSTADGDKCDLFDHLADTPVLLWRRQIPPPRNYRSSLTGRRLQKLQAVTMEKMSNTLKLQTGTTFGWSEAEY